MLLLDQPSKNVPFTLLFVEEIDPSLYTEAIEGSNYVADSYNPETQTSDVSIYAGTQLTHNTTTCGVGFSTRTDDSEVADD